MPFEKGDSNRTRNAYEKVLHEQLSTAVLKPHKKNKHISVGRCRHLAIVHNIALPPYKDLQAVDFELSHVDPSLWHVPTDCQRFAKKVAEEGFCFGNRCDTCIRLFEDKEGGAASSSTASYHSPSPAPSSRASASASPRVHPRSEDGDHQAGEAGLDEDELLLLESSRLVHRVLLSEGMLAPHATARVPLPRHQQQHHQCQPQPPLGALDQASGGGALLDDATEQLLLHSAAEDALLLGGGGLGGGGGGGLLTGGFGSGFDAREMEIDLARLGGILAHGTQRAPHATVARCHLLSFSLSLSHTHTHIHSPTPTCLSPPRALADEIFGADCFASDFTSDFASEASDHGGPARSAASRVTTARTFSDVSDDYASPNDYASSAALAEGTQSAGCTTRTEERASFGSMDSGSGDGSDGSWTLEELTAAVRESDSHMSDARMAAAASGIAAAGFGAAAGGAVEQEAPEALRHVRSLVRQLSSQIKRPAAAEDEDGQNVDGLADVGRGREARRPKRVCRERLPEVLEGLASVERMLEKVGAELEAGCGGFASDDVVGVFRSASQLEQTDAAASRVGKQRRALRIVALRCQRLLEYVSAASNAAPPGSAASVETVARTGPQAAPVKQGKPSAAGKLHATHATTTASAAAPSPLSSAINSVRGWSPFGADDDAVTGSSAAVDVSPLNVSTLPDGRRALLLFCSPLRAPLDCTVEMARLQSVGLLRSSPPPTQGGSFADLRAALRLVQPHILWFAGHGDARQQDGRRTLGFSSDKGEIELFDPVSVAHELRPYLPMFGGNLECIILNACSTGSCGPSHDPAETRLGDLLKQCGAPSVVCWGSPADNTACAAFAAGFGAALMQPRGLAAGCGAVGGYSEAYQRGKREVLAIKMAGAQVGVQTQRFEFVDPTDAARVVQPCESPPRPRRDVYRVRDGHGSGRVAAGVPHLLENAGSAEVASRKGGGATGGKERGGRSRCGWGLLFVGVTLVGAGLGAALLSSLSGALPAELAAAHPPPQRLISIDEDGSLQLEPSALDAIRAAPSPVCVLSVVGPASEGKSTLANAAMLAARGTSSSSPGGNGRSHWLGGNWFGGSAIDGDGVAGLAWMWSSGALLDASSALSPSTVNANATQGDGGHQQCGSVMVLDTAGITSGYLSDSIWTHELVPGASEAAQHRLLSFLMLASSRIVVNTRRQPRLELLERIVASAATAAALRPSPLPLPAAPSSSSSSSAAAALPPPSTSPGGEPSFLDGEPSSGVGAELVMLLRDSHSQLAQGDAQLTDRQMIERWLPGPAGAAVDAVTRSWQLRELPAPSQAELDALEHFGPDGYAAIHQPSSAEGNSRTWGALLSDLAQELTDGLGPAHGWSGVAATDGEALASWMEHVAANVNGMGASSGGQCSSNFDAC